MALNELNHLRSGYTRLRFEAEVEINDFLTVAVVLTFRPALGLRDRIRSVSLHRLWRVLLLLSWGFHSFQLSHDIGLGSVCA